MNKQLWSLGLLFLVARTKGYSNTAGHSGERMVVNTTFVGVQIIQIETASGACFVPQSTDDTIKVHLEYLHSPVGTYTNS